MCVQCLDVKNDACKRVKVLLGLKIVCTSKLKYCTSNTGVKLGQNIACIVVKHG